VLAGNVCLSAIEIDSDRSHIPEADRAVVVIMAAYAGAAVVAAIHNRGRRKGIRFAVDSGARCQVGMSVRKSKVESAVRRRKLTYLSVNFLRASAGPRWTLPTVTCEADVSNSSASMGTAGAGADEAGTACQQTHPNQHQAKLT
jgi:hypothetical protein